MGGRHEAYEKFGLGSSEIPGGAPARHSDGFRQTNANDIGCPRKRSHDGLTASQWWSTSRSFISTSVHPASSAAVACSLSRWTWVSIATCSPDALRKCVGIPDAMVMCG